MKRYLTICMLLFVAFVTMAPSPPGASTGARFFAVKRADITTSSVNLAFGFTSRRVVIETDPANTAELCVDWKGGTAVCPAANTSGDDTIRAGSIILFDDFGVSSVSVIAASGTLTIYVRAYN